MLETPEIVQVLDETLFESPSGASCKFIKVTDKVGIKLYRHEWKRDECFNGQKLAAEYGIGPDVGDFINDLHPEFCFGYVTEVVDMISDDEYGNDEFREEVRILTNHLDKLGLNSHDLAGPNMGRKNGKLVCIDFGRDDGAYGYEYGWANDYGK